MSATVTAKRINNGADNVAEEETTTEDGRGLIIAEGSEVGKKGLPTSPLPNLSRFSAIPFRHPRKYPLSPFQFPLSLFSIPRCYLGDLSAVLIPHGLILDRIQQLAREIHERIGDRVSHLFESPLSPHPSNSCILSLFPAFSVSEFQQPIFAPPPPPHSN